MSNVLFVPREKNQMAITVRRELSSLKFDGRNKIDGIYSYKPLVINNLIKSLQLVIINLNIKY